MDEDVAASDGRRTVEPGRVRCASTKGPEVGARGRAPVRRGALHQESVLDYAAVQFYTVNSLNRSRLKSRPSPDRPCTIWPTPVYFVLLRVTPAIKRGKGA